MYTLLYQVQEDKLASPDILSGLAQRFSSKPVAKKNEDAVDKWVLILTFKPFGGKQA